MTRSFLSWRLSPRGFSLTEMAIILGIAGVVLGTIWVVAAQMIESGRQASALKQIATIAENVRSFYASQRKIDDEDLEDIVIASALAPQDMIDDRASTPALYNPWSGPVDLYGIFDATRYGSGFWVYYGGLSVASCTAMLSVAASQMPAQGLMRYAADDTAFSISGYDFTSGNALSGDGLTKEAAQTACGGNVSTATGGLAFLFAVGATQN
ncbi:MAG: hypothetical protein EBZ69_02660 [Alphaproteobacteria bacterium]|nr:hypothetical protein [Alphaproteobacteria bacterium]